MDKTNLGDRMKGYENITRNYLIKRVPVIIRLDGKSFSKYTRGMKKPFDGVLMETMQETAKYLCENIQGCKLAYTQSDEITLLLTDYEKLNTESFFGYNIQKIVSISASMATLAFNRIFREKYITEIEPFSGEDRDSRLRDELMYSKLDKAMFDSRVFNMSKEEVCNNFIWRQQDCTKNSISCVAQAYFSHKELLNKSGSDKQDMLMLQKGVNWNDFSIPEKRGACVKKVEKVLENGSTRMKFEIDREIPIFSKNRDYIEELL